MHGTKEEMEEWLDKVDKANSLIRDLADGKISTEDFDAEVNQEMLQ